MNFIRRMSATKKEGGAGTSAAGAAPIEDKKPSQGSMFGSGRLSVPGKPPTGSKPAPGKGPSPTSSPPPGDDPDDLPQRKTRSKSVAWVNPPEINEQDINQVLRARSKVSSLYAGPPPPKPFVRTDTTAPQSVKDRKDGGRKSITWGSAPVPVSEPSKP